MPQVNSCPECYEITISECKTEIQLFAGLNPDTDYVVLLTDNLGKKHHFAYTTDGDGMLTIDFNDFPQFNKYSTVKLEVKRELNDVESVDLFLCTYAYYAESNFQCILITFAKTSYTPGIEVEIFCEQIGCEP